MAWRDHLDSHGHVKPSEFLGFSLPVAGSKSIAPEANDAVDGAHSAASKCHRVVGSKRNHIEGSRPWAKLA
jgi:hypothetical protein